MKNKNLYTLTLIILSTFASASSATLVGSAPSSVSFTRLTSDITRNRIHETIECGGGSVIVRRRNGSVAYQWNYANDRLPGYPTARRGVRNCSIAHLNGGVNAIMVSTHWARQGAQPAASDQYVIYREWTGSKNIVRRAIRVNGSLYQPVSRSVKCEKMPASAIKTGNAAGAFCFHAAYNQTINGEIKTKTALLKVEKYRNTIIFKDATSSTGLPWSGGVNGSSEMRMMTPCTGPRRYDGVHMMDSTFVKSSRYGLSTLVTAGQHSTLRSHAMVIDTSRTYGIRFINRDIVSAVCGNDSEYLSVTAMNEFDGSAANGCMYVTGENNTEGGAFIATPDHILCNYGGNWSRVDISNRVTYSGIQPITPKKVPNSDRIMIKIREQNAYIQFDK